MDFEILFSMLESAVSSTEAVSVQAEFFRKFYADASLRGLPFVNAFLIVSGWLGNISAQRRLDVLRGDPAAGCAGSGRLSGTERICRACRDAAKGHP